MPRGCLAAALAAWCWWKAWRRLAASLRRRWALQGEGPSGGFKKADCNTAVARHTCAWGVLGMATSFQCAAMLVGASPDEASEAAVAVRHTQHPLERAGGEQPAARHGGGHVVARRAEAYGAAAVAAPLSAAMQAAAAAGAGGPEVHAAAPAVAGVWPACPAPLPAELPAPPEWR